jgi:DNA-binding CsgD family transcriptional regulator
MQEALFDIRNAAAMELIFDEDAMAVWEFIRRRARPTSAPEVAESTGLTVERVQDKIELLAIHGLLEAVPARASRKFVTYRVTHARIGIVLQPNDAGDRQLWDGYSARIREAAAQLAKNEMPLEQSEAERFARCFYVMPVRLEPSELDELRQRLDELTSFLRLLQEKHAGDVDPARYGCNYRFELQLQPLATRVLPQPVVVMRARERDLNRGAERLDAMSRLSARERQVAQAIVRGFTRADTAAQLGIKPGSVATLTKRIYRKLGICNRMQLSRCIGHSVLPDSVLPDSGLPESGLPESGLPEPGLPESGLPESAVA